MLSRIYIEVGKIAPMHRENWAEVNAEVITNLQRATTDRERERCFKLLIVAPCLFFRKTARGGNRKEQAIAQRFADWLSGDHAKLFDDWARDVALSRGSEPRERSALDNDVRKALGKLERGLVSDAARLLESHGVADVFDPEIMEQMRLKHPTRMPGNRMEDSPPTPDPSARLKVLPETVKRVYGMLPRERAQGASTWTYEMLTAISPSVPFASGKANEAVGCHAWLATGLANGDFPPWFNFILAAIRLIPLHKNDRMLPPGETPDVRPIGISCALRRGLTRCIFAEGDLRESMRVLFSPTQLAVFVPSGGTKLVFAVRELLDAHPEFCAVNIDMKNAFNSVTRAGLLREALADPSTAVLARFLHSLLAPKSLIFGGSGEFLEQILTFCSEEGVQQGSVEGMIAFAMAIRADLGVLDAELEAECGGAARAGADDVTAIGTPAAVFPAVARFLASVREKLGLEANLLKTVCYIHPDPIHTAELDRHRNGVPLGVAHADDGSAMLGIKIYGIPLGSPEFVAHTLASKCTQITGTSQKLNSLLGLTHKQALWTITLRSTSQKGGYWAQHCYPEESLGFCLGVDDAILKQASLALGCDPSNDPLALKRVYLPTRLTGLGLTSLVASRSAAFLASAARAVPSFLDKHDAAGEVMERGVLERPSIVARIGRDTLAAPETQGWRTFGASTSRLGAAIITTGSALRAQVPDGYTGELRVLRTCPEEIGLRGKGTNGAGLQAAITADLQQIEHDTMSELLGHRTCGDRQRQLFRNVGRESGIIFTVIPIGPAKVPNDEWCEIAARFLGRPSPACAQIVGHALPQVVGQGVRHVDAFGDRLAASTKFQGDHISKFQHDLVVAALARFATTLACTDAKAEDADIFASVLRQNPGQMRNEDAQRRTRMATIDLRVAIDLPDGQTGIVHLVEMKSVHLGQNYITTGSAVENRSGKLDAERRKQFQKCDREVFGTAEGEVGPMEQKLNSFPSVIGIATGGFMEWSKSLDDLLKTFAAMGAETWMGKLGAPTVKQARFTLRGIMRRELAVIVARGHAKLIIARARSLHTQTARAAAGAQGTPWFQRAGSSANGPEDAPAHMDGAYQDDDWRAHNAERHAERGAAQGAGRGRGRGRPRTRT
jgi:hypothetical protein